MKAWMAGTSPAAMTWKTPHRYSTARTSATFFRKQSRHRQSPPSSGIGNRATSSAHQHGPARPQVNSVPQPEQASRRDGRFSN